MSAARLMAFQVQSDFLKSYHFLEQENITASQSGGLGLLNNRRKKRPFSLNILCFCTCLSHQFLLRFTFSFLCGSVLSPWPGC